MIQKMKCFSIDNTLKSKCRPNGLIKNPQTKDYDFCFSFQTVLVFYHHGFHLKQDVF